MSINANLGYQLGPGKSYNSIEQDLQASASLRAYQQYVEQEALRRYRPPILYHYEPQPTRTNMKNWLRVLQDDIHTNHTRINALETEPQQPLPAEDSKLTKLELHLRRALSDILTQRANTEAAKQALKG